MWKWLSYNKLILNWNLNKINRVSKLQRNNIYDIYIYGKEDLDLIEKWTKWTKIIALMGLAPRRERHVFALK